MFELRDYQQEAVDSIDEFFFSGGQDPVLVEPTGAGKSVIIAAHVSRYHQAWETRFMVMAHVSELLEQNYDAITRYDPALHVGLYSSGLGLKQPRAPIVVGGIQSCYRKAHVFGHRDVCIVDEAHLINPKSAGMYRKFIKDLREINPLMRVVGFTATHYRLGHGYIHEGDDALFTGVCHETKIDFLIDRGYLVPPTCKAGSISADLSEVRHTGGEFNEKDVSKAFAMITTEACTDMIAKSTGRQCRMVFCSTIKHAVEVYDCLESMGCSDIEYVDGKTKRDKRIRIVNDVKSGGVQWLINVGVFTTGFDAGIVDCIIFLRATESTGLYVQIIGRGLRLHPEKENCLVLDYGENVLRHGPLNALRIKTPGKKTDTVMAKACPSCEELVAKNSCVCPLCGYVWIISEKEERQVTHETEAADLDILYNPDPVVRKVHRMECRRHRKVGKPDTMRVTYHCGLGADDRISEWLCFDHTGFAKSKATTWAMESGFIGDTLFCPAELTVSTALDIQWPVPFSITVRRELNGYFSILSRDYYGVDNLAHA